MSDFTLEDKVIQIIELSQQRDYSSLEFLAEALGVGTRSVRNYIKKVNEELEGIACLDNKRGKGFWLSIQDQSSFDLLMNHISSKKNLMDSSKRRIAYIIERLINNEVIITLDELAYEMNISRTTLVNELKKASVSLEAYNLKIHGKPNTGISLDGVELDIRFFIINNVFEMIYRSYPLDQDIEEEITTIAARHDFESSTQKRLMEFVIVMLDRLLKNQPLKKVKDSHLKLKHTHDYQIGLEIAAVIEKCLPITIPESEIIFITIPIAGRRTPTNNRSIENIAIPGEIKRLLELIVENIGFKKDIIEENESFFIDLQYHLTFMINRLMFGLRIENPMLMDVKEKYPVAFQMAKIAGDIINKEYDLDVSDDELGYIAFYFGVFISQSEVKVKSIRKAAVICGTGRGTAKLVSNQLQRILNKETELKLFSETEVTKELLNEFDIIFSTVKLSIQTSKPVILINEIFDEQAISRKIEEVAYMKAFRIKADSNSHSSILNHLISKESFFLLNSKVDYHDNLYTMVDELVKTGHLDHEFINRLKEREKKGSMVFDRYIAIPHTFNYQSDQIKLALGVFPDTVISDGKDIKLIFLLGIPEQQSEMTEHQLVSVYDEIIRIANDEKVINQLASAANYEDVSECLKKISKFS
ncbi:BglG family transcription antiterminator [Bacillus sp. Au-Bac7]|uniref:BglG family transcription antiterminator n=1 Tax=Bacillus sp. Au-Bac7 TaxID=2906458 RepID=UPI001E61F8EC|nr:BglG family transcription antiterminator [Bacillus sp. Au-Bac7]MCE4050084.1 BglG family transcription antiterminator [Bacillus sp. Au-Bac7]